MTSAKSCKSPERTWLIETLRRCKALPVLIAVAYFLSNILPILLSYSRLERVITYVYSSMTGSNLLNILIGIAGGVVVSCAVFRYLHSNASVIDAHAKPLTRTQLFRGSFFAGLMMVVAPVVLTGLLYLCVMGAHGTVDLTTTMENLGMGDWSKQINAEHILCVSNIIGWILDNIVVIGFTYCVSCFAAILAGTAAIQALLSLLLISVASIVYSFFLGYMDTFLYGYTGSNTSLLTYLSPYGFLMMRDAFPFESVPVTLIVYAVISALIAFAAVAVYRKIRLENEEQTIVVPFVADLLVILLTALAVSTVLFIAQNFLAIDSAAGSVITIVLATIVFFPVFCMIADQSFRIFKGRNARVFIIYAAVMCLVLAFTLFDVTGFEKRVPEVSKVASVDISDSNLINTEYKGIKDEDTIAQITALHKSIAGEGKHTDMDIPADDVKDGGQAASIGGVQIDYHLKNGKTITRYYGLIYPASYDAYAAYYRSEKIREHDCIDEKHPFRTGQFMSVNDTHVNKYGDYIDSNTYKVPDENLKGIIRAANKDIMNWTAENRELFLAVEEYDPKKDKSSYTLSISVDYSLSEETVSKLEAYNRYYMFKTSDQNMTNYIEKHPGLMSDKNVIADDDPTWGGNEM